MQLIKSFSINHNIQEKFQIKIQLTTESNYVHIYPYDFK